MGQDSFFTEVVDSEVKAAIQEDADKSYHKASV